MTEIEKAIQEFEDNAYHNSLHPEISEKSKAVALATLLAQRETGRNDPLTPEELLEMDGEPVWLVSSVDEPQWAIVVNDSYYHGKIVSFFCAGCVEWEFDLYGDNDGETYLAYRHKPKEA